jgi:hypothetical protein
MSADWNAQQATEEVGWPTLVSKEILKLSLGEESAPTGSGQAPIESGHQPATRAENVLNVPGLTHSFASPVSPPSPLAHPISSAGESSGLFSGPC